MTESNAVENLLPEGWYRDPANDQMQRWWTGTVWTDHVRYAERPRLHAVAPQPVDASVRVTTAPVELPVAAAAPQPDYPVSDPRLDDYYVPMRGFSGPSTSSSRVPSTRTSFAAAGLWLLVVASIGIAIGVTLWVVIPHR